MSKQFRHRSIRVAAGAFAVAAIAAPAAAARPVIDTGTHSGEPPAMTVTRSIEQGFDWGSAGVGAGVAAGLLLLLAAAVSARRSRRMPQIAATLLIGAAVAAGMADQASARPILPDLVVSEYETHSHVTVRNQGNARAGAFHIRVPTYEGTRQYYIAGLAPWSTVTVPATVPCGSRWHTAIVDPYNWVGEGNEGNNSRTAWGIC